jgi:hypothetical protein
MRRFVLVLLAWCGCHRNQHQEVEVGSCLIEHDGGVTQCFDDIGVAAKHNGPQACDKMHGKHAFRLGASCPFEGVVASCTKGAGTDYERVERCYHDEPGCAARCQKSDGVLAH